MHTVHRHHWVALPRVALLMGVALSHVCHFLATSSAAGCAATDDSPWERLRSAVLDPSMSAAAHSYVLGGESKNFVRDDESEHLHDTDIRVVGPSRGPRRALEWCFQPYKSTTAARGIAWSFAGAVDPECFWNRLWAALMFGAVVFQIYALMYASAFLNTGGSWPARLDVEMLIVDILYDTPTGVCAGASRCSGAHWCCVRVSCWPPRALGAGTSSTSSTSSFSGTWMRATRSWT